MKVNKCFLTITIISGMVLLYSRCINSSKPDIKDVRGTAYAGSLTCLQCHKDVNNTYLHTAHSQTSWAERHMPEKIAASADRFIFNGQTTVAVERRDSGIYQVAYINGKDSIAKRFEIGFGSGG